MYYRYSCTEEVQKKYRARPAPQYTHYARDDTYFGLIKSILTSNEIYPLTTTVDIDVAAETRKINNKLYGYLRSDDFIKQYGKDSHVNESLDINELLPMLEHPNTVVFHGLRDEIYRVRIWKIDCPVGDIRHTSDYNGSPLTLGRHLLKEKDKKLSKRFKSHHRREFSLFGGSAKENEQLLNNSGIGHYEDINLVDDSMVDMGEDCGGITVGLVIGY